MSKVERLCWVMAEAFYAGESYAALDACQELEGIVGGCEALFLCNKAFSQAWEWRRSPLTTKIYRY